MHPGLLAPSARHQDGIHLAIFTPRVLSSPELAEHLTYQLEPSSLQLTIVNHHTKKIVVCIDGRKLF